MGGAFQPCSEAVRVSPHLPLTGSMDGGRTFPWTIFSPALEDGLWVTSGGDVAEKSHLLEPMTGERGEPP